MMADNIFRPFSICSSRRHAKLKTEAQKKKAGYTVWPVSGLKHFFYHRSLSWEILISILKSPKKCYKKCGDPVSPRTNHGILQCTDDALPPPNAVHTRYARWFLWISIFSIRNVYWSIALHIQSDPVTSNTQGKQKLVRYVGSVISERLGKSHQRELKNSSI